MTTHTTKIYFPNGFLTEFRTINLTPSTIAYDVVRFILPKFNLEKKNLYGLYKVSSKGEGLFFLNILAT